MKNEQFALSSTVHKNEECFRINSECLQTLK